MHELVASVHGQSVTYRLDDGALKVLGASGERTIPLADVVQVRLGTLPPMKMCELQVRGAAPQTIVTDERASYPAYDAFVRALHGALPPAATFLRGSWDIVGIIAVVGAVFVGLAVATRAGLVAPPEVVASKASLIAGLWCVAGPIAMWKARPRAYDPASPPL